MVYFIFNGLYLFGAHCHKQGREKGSFALGSDCLLLIDLIQKGVSLFQFVGLFVQLLSVLVGPLHQISVSQRETLRLLRQLLAGTIDRSMVLRHILRA